MRSQAHQPPSSPSGSPPPPHPLSQGVPASATAGKSPRQIPISSHRGVTCEARPINPSAPQLGPTVASKSLRRCSQRQKKACPNRSRVWQTGRQASGLLEGREVFQAEPVRMRFTRGLRRSSFKQSCDAIVRMQSAWARGCGAELCKQAKPRHRLWPHGAATASHALRKCLNPPLALLPWLQHFCKKGRTPPTSTT